MPDTTTNQIPQLGDNTERDEWVDTMIRREVLYCQSGLVEDLIHSDAKDAVEGFSYDSDIENLYPDPSYWGVEECRDWLDDHGIEHPDLDPFTDDQNTLCELLAVDVDGVDIVFMYQAALHCEDCGRAIKAQLPITTVDSGDSDDYPQGPYSNAGGEADSLQYCDTCGTRLSNALTTDGVALLQKQVIEAMNNKSIDGLAEWREAVTDNTEAAEVLEWWLVSDWLCGELREVGEVVIDNGYGHWWGRCCTGQAIKCDPTMYLVADAVLSD